MEFGKLGLRKINRKSNAKKAVLKIPPALVGPIFIFGKIRSGKTVTMLTLSGIYHDNEYRKYKIVDVWGGERNENLYWGLPSNKKKYWSYLKSSLKLDAEGPKQYKVEYLYPMNSKLRKKLPFNPPNVTSKIMTFDIRDMKQEDFSLVVGSISENSVGLWNETIFDSKKNDSAYEIAAKFRKKISKNNILYNSVINPLIKNLLLQNKNSIFNFGSKEISAMISDQETISVIVLDCIDKEFQLFVVGYIIRKIAEDLDRRRKKVILNMREVSEFFNVGDFSIVPERFKVMKSKLSSWVRLGRRGMHFILDVQSASEVRGLVGGQQDLTYLGRLPDQRDREEATRQLVRDGLIRDNHVKVLGVNNPGQFVVCPSGGRTQYNYMFLPRCRYWEETNGNFYTNIWEKEVGRWITYAEEKEQLREHYQKDKEEYDLKETERKQKASKKKRKRENVINDIKPIEHIVEKQTTPDLYSFIDEVDV